MTREAAWKLELPVLMPSREKKTGPYHNYKSETALGKYNLGLTADVIEALPEPRKCSIRSTPMGTLSSCPRKFLFSHRLGIQASSYQSALELGGYYHLMLQGIYMGQTDDEAMKGVTRQYEKDVRDAVDLANEGGYMPDGSLIKAVLTQMDIDYHKSMAMALAFVKFNPFNWDEYEILKTPEGQPMVEALLKVTIPTIAAPIVAPCDLAIRKKGTNQVWIVDHKTTSMSPRTRAQMSLISSQMKLYRLALQTHLDLWAEEGHEKLEAVGGCLTAILKPGIKYCPSTKDSGGFHVYAERVSKWFTDYEESHPDDPPVISFFHRFTEPVLTTEFLYRLKEVSRASTCDPDLESFYRVGYPACSDFKRLCTYFDLCSSAPATWPAILADPRFKIEHREDNE